LRKKKRDSEGECDVTRYAGADLGPTEFTKGIASQTPLKSCVAYNPCYIRLEFLSYFSSSEITTNMPSIIEIDSDEAVDLPQAVHDNPPAQATARQKHRDASASAGSSWLRAEPRKRRIHMEQKLYAKARMKQLQRRLPELPMGVTACGLPAGMKWYRNHHIKSKSLTLTGGAYY
jgi:hypothetical protein